MTLHDQFGEGDGEMGLELYDEQYREALGWGAGNAGESVPWSAKKPVAYFSAGGGAVNRGNRSKLFVISKEHPHLLETSAKATKCEHMSTYKYNVYAYGHCGWSRRIHELAMMETVVLVEDSICREFMHGLFSPSIDHLAVAENFADIPEKMAAALADEAGGGRMAAR